MVFITMTIFTITRVLIMIFQEAVYVRPGGHCKDTIDFYTVTPITQYISVTFFILVFISQVLFTIFIRILLSKNNNSTQSVKSHKCMLKIVVIISCSTLLSTTILNNCINKVCIINVKLSEQSDTSFTEHQPTA